MVKIVLGVVLGLVSLGMLLYLVPMPNTGLNSSGNTDTLANVAGQTITVGQVQQELDVMSQQQQIPQQMQGLYARQILDEMIFSRLLEVESSKMGVSVSNQEVADQIRQLLPTAFPNGKWVGAQAYSAMVQQEFGLTVSSFEDELRQSLLQQKFRNLVTADVSVTPQDVREEYLRQNQKVKVDYVLVDPSALIASLHPDKKELEAWYNAHKSEYQVPEQRSANYLLLDVNQLKKNTVIPHSQLLAYYNAHIDQYKVPDRVHVEHILFMTVGKTTAEIEVIKKKAEKVLAMVQKGGNFAKLAKQYSEDPGSKNKGGDLGWIVRGQTVPAFQKVAFSLPVGQVSNLVKTQYGFDIIKVLGKENAHTKSFADVSSQIEQTLLNQQVQQESQQISNQMANIVRDSSRQTLAAVEQALGPKVKPDLITGKTPLVTVTEPITGLGSSTDLRNALFSQSVGQLSLPIQIAQGYVILNVNKIVPSHQGTFTEVTDRVVTDYLEAKSAEAAQTEAASLAAAVKKGKPLNQVAKSAGLQVQSAEFSRTGNVAGQPASKFLAAFNTPVGQMEGPQKVGNNWIVYTVTAHEQPSQASFEAQRASIRQELLTTARNNAFDAFRTALENQMKKQGQLTINNQNLKELTSPSQS